METENEVPELGIKKWMMKSLSVTVFLLMVVYAVEVYFDVPLVVDVLLAITLILSIAFVHESLHYWQAVKLGYRPKWWRTTFRMGFEITPHSNREKWRKDNKKIALAPYYFAIPVSLLLILIGYILGSMGIAFAGGGSLVLHAISYPSEGKET